MSCKKGSTYELFISIFISLTCLRNEEAITSTWSRISSWQVFNFVLYRKSSFLQDILFYIWYLTICFWIDWVHVYKYTKIKGLDLSTREIMIIAREQKTENENVQWKFTTPHQLATTSAPVIEVLLIKILLFVDH